MSSQKKIFIAIIIVNYNGKEDTTECLLSLEKSHYKHFLPIVIDNGSTDQSSLFLREKFPKLILLESEENLGFAGGNNLGIEKALSIGCDAVLLLNNDVIIDEDMLGAFAKATKQYPDSILGGKVFRFDEPELLDHIGGRWIPSELKYDLVGFRKPGKTHFNEVLSLDYIYGCAMLIPRVILEKIGLLEPKFFLYWEEVDYCTRAKKAGFSLLFLPNARLWHKGSASLTEQIPPKAYYFWRNRLFWLKRNYSTAHYLSSLFTKMSFYLTKLFLRFIYYEIYMTFCFIFFPDRITRERLVRRKTIRVSLLGALHYFTGRMGNAPSWVYTPIDTS